MRLNLALSEPRARLDAISFEDKPSYKLKRKISHPFMGEGLVSPPLSDQEVQEAELIWDIDYVNSVEDYKEKKISQLSEKEKDGKLGDEIIKNIYKDFRTTQSKRYATESQEKARINYLQIIGQYPLLPLFEFPSS